MKKLIQPHPYSLLIRMRQIKKMATDISKTLTDDATDSELDDAEKIVYELHDEITKCFNQVKILFN